MPQQAIVTKAHQRSYETAIMLNKGQAAKATKRDMWDDQHLWIWCVSETGGEGWVPDSFLQLEDDVAIALRDYHAIELTVQEGEKLIVFENVNGWYWVENSNGEQGWIPVKNAELI